MRLEDCILACLYKFDKVTLNDFGTFYINNSQKASSKSDVLSHTLHKQLEFSLDYTNDQVLISELASVEGVSKVEAENFISKKLKSWTNSIQSSKQLKVDNLGEFKLNQSNELIFIPFIQNFALETFGLPSSVTLTPIVKENEKRIYNFEFTDYLFIILFLSIVFSFVSFRYYKPKHLDSWSYVYQLKDELLNSSYINSVKQFLIGDGLEGNAEAKLLPMSDSDQMNSKNNPSFVNSSYSLYLQTFDNIKDVDEFCKLFSEDSLLSEELMVVNLDSVYIIKYGESGSKDEIIKTYNHLKEKYTNLWISHDTISVEESSR